MNTAINKINENTRLEREDIIALYESNDLFALGNSACNLAEKIHGKNVFYTKNRHLNPTNLCVNRCKFCAFSRSKGETGAYEYAIEDIIGQLRRAQTEDGGLPFLELHIVGGLHPDWPFSYYVDLLREIKGHYPDIYIKAFTAVEIDYMAKISGLIVDEVLVELKKSGLDMMPGGGAEIFSESVRNRLCPEKITGKEWLNIHKKAHMHGIKTNATMLYGHIERYEDRAEHLLMLRQVQDETGGFLAFIPLSFQPKNTELVESGGSGIDDLKTIAISRLVLDNFPHIKAYWIMLGEKISQTALLFGANDIDGTVVDEKIGHAAGASSSTFLSVNELRHFIEKAGKVPVERDTLYRVENGNGES